MAVQRARWIAGASMCKKEKKDKKEKKAKKAKSSGAGASASQCTLKLVEEHKDLLSPQLSMSAGDLVLSHTSGIHDGGDVQ